MVVLFPKNHNYVAQGPSLQLTDNVGFFCLFVFFYDRAWGLGETDQKNTHMEEVIICILWLTL